MVFTTLYVRFRLAFHSQAHVHSSFVHAALSVCALIAQRSRTVDSLSRQYIYFTLLKLRLYYLECAARYSNRYIMCSSTTHTHTCHVQPLLSICHVQVADGEGGWNGRSRFRHGCYRPGSSVGAGAKEKVSGSVASCSASSLGPAGSPVSDWRRDASSGAASSRPSSSSSSSSSPCEA